MHYRPLMPEANLASHDMMRTNAHAARLPASNTVATILPLFRQSQYLLEAVTSVIGPNIAHSSLIIVNDGCPDKDSDALPRLLRQLSSDIVYLRKENGGPSSARNIGIQYVLAHMPEVEFLFFLDADNFVGPDFFDICLNAFNSKPDADWLYFPLRVFGKSQHDWYFPKFNRYRQFFENQCDAAAMVRRHVFEKGALFDETLRSGYEDWEFFLQLGISGYKGERIDEAEIFYRMKHVSRNTEADINRAIIINEIHSRHGERLAPRALTQLEHEVAPRFLAIDIESWDWACFTDPDDINWQSHYPIPQDSIGPVTIFVTKRSLDALARTNILRGALFLIQEGARHNFVKVVIKRSDAGFKLNVSRHDNEFHMWAGSTHSIAVPERHGGANSIVKRSPCINIEIPRAAATFGPEQTITAPVVISAIDQFESRLNWHANNSQPRPRSERAQATLHSFLWHKHGHSFDTTYPLVTDGRPHVAFIAPWLQLGGVDLCVRNIAREMKAIHPDLCLHLVLTLENNAWLSAGDATLFDNILPIGHIEWKTRLQICDAITSCVDLTINAHSQAGYESLDLRRGRTPNLRFGRVISYLHVLDETKRGKLGGYCFDAADQDAVLDGHVVISEQLQQFMINSGVPRGRIKIARNAAIVSPATLDDGLRLAAGKAAEAGRLSKITLLFAGRLDYQKGLTRLRALVDLAKTLPAKAEFTIVGKEFLGGTGIDWPAEYCRLHPPTNDSELLSSYYRDADIFVLLSRWEGVPLAMIDAMAHGCVVIATDVGAVTEVLADGVNGFIVPSGSDNEVAAHAMRILESLARDESGAAAIRAAAVRTAFKYKWRDAASVFLEWLDTKPDSAVKGVHQ